MKHKITPWTNCCKKAEKTAKETFETGGLGSGLPEIKIKISEISKGLSILDFLSNNKITSSKNELTSNS